MKSLLKKFMATMGAAALLALPSVALVPLSAHAQSSIQDNVCQGLKNTGTDSCEDDGEDNSFAGLAKKIINIFSIVVGTVSVVMIIIGGFRYIISGGDSNGVSGAKNTILYAIVGLVIVLFAQVIVRFVLTNAKTS